MLGLFVLWKQGEDSIPLALKAPILAATTETTEFAGPLKLAT